MSDTPEPQVSEDVRAILREGLRYALSGYDVNDAKVFKKFIADEDVSALLARLVFLSEAEAERTARDWAKDTDTDEADVLTQRVVLNHRGQPEGALPHEPSEAEWRGFLASFYDTVLREPSWGEMAEQARAGTSIDHAAVRRDNVIETAWRHIRDRIPSGQPAVSDGEIPTASPKVEYYRGAMMALEAADSVHEELQRAASAEAERLADVLLDASKALSKMCYALAEESSPPTPAIPGSDPEAERLAKIMDEDVANSLDGDSESSHAGTVVDYRAIAQRLRGQANDSEAREIAAAARAYVECRSAGTEAADLYAELVRRLRAGQHLGEA